MVSLVQPLENGAMIEVGMIGNEGFAGVPVLLGADRSPLEAMVQIPGSALRIPLAPCRFTTKATCCRIFTPVLPDHPAASLRDFCSGAYTSERVRRSCLARRAVGGSRRCLSGHA